MGSVVNFPGEPVDFELSCGVAPPVGAEADPVEAGVSPEVLCLAPLATLTW